MSGANSAPAPAAPAPAAPAPKKISRDDLPKLGFWEEFMISGVAAGAAKTAAAPIERVKLLVQNQGEMIKQGTLDRPYNASSTA